MITLTSRPLKELVFKDDGDREALVNSILSLVIGEEPSTDQKSDKEMIESATSALSKVAISTGTSVSELAEMYKAVKSKDVVTMEKLAAAYGFDPMIKLLMFIHTVRATKRLPWLLMEMAEKVYTHRTEVLGMSPESAKAGWHKVLHLHVFHKASVAV